MVCFFHGCIFMNHVNCALGKLGLLNNIRTIPKIYPSDYIVRIYFDKMDEVLTKVSTLHYVDLCDINKLYFEDILLSSKTRFTQESNIVNHRLELDL